MAHFYPGTVVEISCYYIHPLSSSLLYSLILSFHSRHSFVQSAVFTTGDPVFFSLSIYPFPSISSFSFAVFIDPFPCSSLSLLVLKFLFFIISFSPIPSIQTFILYLCEANIFVYASQV